MDLNGDGYRDMITGHYWPGDIFVFWGNAEGEFSKMENLKDETGRNLNAGEEWKSESEPRMQSLAAAPYATDWDGDGDYDILIGNISGQIVLMKNIGSKTNPEFSIERTILTANDTEINVPHGDAGPVHEDWDQDGKRDLLVGAGDGSVLWYKNVGSENQPKFGAGQQLIGPQVDKSFGYQSEPVRPGTRVKICVTDYNGDGMVDLLVGDFINQDSEPIKLSEQEIARRDELQRQIDQLSEKTTAAYTEFQNSIKDLEKESDEFKAALKDYEEILESFDPGDVYTEYRKYVNNGTYHGFVWLYLRQSTEYVSTDASSAQLSAKQAP